MPFKMTELIEHGLINEDDDDDENAYQENTIAIVSYSVLYFHEISRSL
jgi:hypothetical protein